MEMYMQEMHPVNVVAVQGTILNLISRSGCSIRKKFPM